MTIYILNTFLFFSVYLMYIYMHIYEYNNEVSGKAE